MADQAGQEFTKGDALQAEMSMGPKSWRWIVSAGVGPAASVPGRILFRHVLTGPILLTLMIALILVLEFAYMLEAHRPPLLRLVLSNPNNVKMVAATFARKLPPIYAVIYFLILVTFNALVYLPAFVGWNRRARAIQAGANVDPWSAPESGPPTWPPPPASP